MSENKNTNRIPKTESELEAWMKENCFHFNNYAINGNAIHEGFGIDRLGGLFVWYYTERGQQNNMAYFATEEAVVEHAYKQLSADASARKHCIGFTLDKVKAIELTQALRLRSVNFTQDEIPYYGPDKPAFRTFVFGCDCRRVQDLKEKYYKPPV